MNELILKLDLLPINSAEFRDGFEVLLNNIDNLDKEGQVLFANLVEKFINQDDKIERVNTK